MRNWTIKDAVEVIKAGTDKESIREIAKHFPMFFMAVATNDISALTAAMNDKFTVRRLVFDDAVITGNNDEDEDGTTNGATEDDDTGADVDLSKLSTKELMKLCDKRGIKVPHYGKNKQFYLDVLQSNATDDGDEANDEDTGDEYEDKSAQELYKLCKKRGINVAPKKPAKFYADALRKDDAEQVDTDDDDVDTDDWNDEDEAPDEKQEKKSAKNGKKSNKPVQAKAEDDDDDWDI